ncbi:MAG: hypothetical protein ACFFD1_10930 [Candidatus Thorarchaeota archaeon]
MITKKSPFQGRTYISLYLPVNGPISAIKQQLQHEIERSNRSTNWQVKGIVVMMLKSIIEYINNLGTDFIQNPGKVLFVLPQDHKSAFVYDFLPDKGNIDLFSYNLSDGFFVDDTYFHLIN